MSAFQIEIELGGEKRNVIYDMWAFSKWCRMEGIPMRKFQERLYDIDMEGFANLTYWAIRASDKKGEAEFTADDVLIWFEDMEAYMKLFDAMSEAASEEEAEEAKPAKKKKPVQAKGKA